MKTTMLFRRVIASWRAFAVFTLAGGTAFSVQAKTPVFGSFNSVSDLLGVANYTDKALANPWGLTTGTEGNLHVCDNGPGETTLYAPSGEIFTGGTNAVTVQPAVSGTEPGSPSGINIDNYNIFSTTATNDFVITSGTVSAEAHYLYCTEDGAIEGFRAEVSSTSTVIGPNDANQNAAGAGYTGIALSWQDVTTGTGSSAVTKLEHRLYAANFAQGKINVFDNEFHLVAPSGTSSFVVPHPPAVSGTGLAWSPFNIHRLDYTVRSDTKRLLVVAYALHATGTDANPMDDVPGAGNGYLALFQSDGTFVSVGTASSGIFSGTSGATPTNWNLNSPWGIAVAHAPIAKFDAPIVVLVGNHGDGSINAFSFLPKFLDLSGVHLGTLLDDHGAPLAFGHLWALHFGPKKFSIPQYLANPADLTEDDFNLYFSAGIANEEAGLVGKIIIP